MSGLYYADFISFYSPTQLCGGGTTKSNSNESEFGLQGAVFTQDYPRAFAIAEQLEVGTVHINNKTQRGTDNFPFLGVKGSGAGTQGVKYSIEAMTRVKSTVFDIANY